MAVVRLISAPHRRHSHNAARRFGQFVAGVAWARAESGSRSRARGASDRAFCAVASARRRRSRADHDARLAAVSRLLLLVVRARLRRPRRGRGARSRNSSRSSRGSRGPADQGMERAVASGSNSRRCRACSCHEVHPVIGRKGCWRLESASDRLCPVPSGA